MARYTKKRQNRKKSTPVKKYTKRMYGGEYGEHVRGLMSDVAGTFADDIAEKTSEIIKNKLSNDFGEKVAEKAADKVIVSMAQVFQDAAAKIAEKEPVAAPLLTENLGEVQEESPSVEEETSPTSEVVPVEEEVPTEEVPTEEVPTEEVPTEEVPTEEAPVEEVPTEEAPVEEVPAPSTGEVLPPPADEIATPQTMEVPPQETNTSTEAVATPPVEQGMETGPAVPESEEAAVTGEGDKAVPMEKKGGKSRAVRGKKRNTSRNNRNKQRQYQSQYY